MKVSVNWLKKFTDVDLPIDNLVEKIGAQLGEVEEIIDIGKKYEGIIIVKVVSCIKHPNADKLSVCQIDTGTKKVQVVCGAPNVHEGMLAIWIPPGNAIPATFDKDPLVLEKREIRGEMSNGMLASGSELAINDDHSGVVELENGKPGDSFAKAFGLDDYIIDIENKMFTHRPDCFGLLGVAREIAGIQHKPFSSPDWYLNEQKTGENKVDKDLLIVKNELANEVPRFMAQIIQNVVVKPSPLEVQAKLKKVGIKSINNVVDVTNYVMYLTGQPLHAYDYDKVAKLSGKTPTILVRKPKKGEKLKVLGGKVIQPHGNAIMIATDKQLIGIGGVIGGADTEVDIKTKNIILECANFDLYSIRRTSMMHGLFTDAVTRFSKGQSPIQNDKVLAYAIKDIARITGGTPAHSIYDIKTKSKLAGPSRIGLDSDFINQRLGLSLSSSDIATMLANVEFEVVKSGKNLTVTAPFWRTDIEIPEDVVEEVGRLYGYDNLPLDLPSRKASPAIIDDELKAKQEIRSKLASLGANELLNYSFVHGDLLDKSGQDRKLAFKIKNALSPELQYYRLSLSPSLLDKVHANIKAGFSEFAIFEIGKVHDKSELGDEGIPKELGRTGLVVTGDYYQAKHFLEQLYPNDSKFSYLRLDSKLDKKFADHKMFNQMIAPYETARSAIAFVNSRPVGIVGEFKLSVAKAMKLPESCAGFELFLSSLGRSDPAYKPLSRFPETEQDITLRTKIDLPYSDIYLAVVEALSKNTSEDITTKAEPLDIFSKDKTLKNTTFRIYANSSKRTLTTEIINNLLDKVSAELKKSIQAERI